ncbi:MAG TPA: hypothetical protein VMW29_03690 [Candidatus Bathyarchaeia archaeon]|nr:hypothetical protein [Candidatus Bathyarchaeia archaeon]
MLGEKIRSFPFPLEPFTGKRGGRVLPETWWRYEQERMNGLRKLPQFAQMLEAIRWDFQTMRDIDELNRILARCGCPNLIKPFTEQDIKGLEYVILFPLRGEAIPSPTAASLIDFTAAVIPDRAIHLGMQPCSISVGPFRQGETTFDDVLVATPDHIQMYWVGFHGWGPLCFQN